MKLLPPDRLDRLQERKAKRSKKEAIEDGLRTFMVDQIVKGKSMKREEDALQRQQVQYLRILEAQGRLIFFAVPNGGKRSKIEAAIMKGLGVRAGVPDLVILHDQKCSFIENKSAKGRLSPSQMQFIDYCARHGYYFHLCRNFQQFLNTLYDWGIISKKEAGI